MFDGNIYVSTEFQTAINVAYDLNSEEKVSSFIPTAASLNIIQDIMHSVSSSSNKRARILIGAYGRGKSHIILQLVSILCKRNLIGVERFLEKIPPANHDLKNSVSNYLDRSQMLLPIIIDGNSMSLTQSFLNAIRVSLSNEGLDKFMPTTGFSLIYDNIQKWKTDFPSTYEEFGRHLNCPIKEFEVKIKSHDMNAYETFLMIYPKVTSGSQFNPFVNSSVLDILDEIIVAIRPLGYSGVYIIYDEFSKYLEANIANTQISDIKLLQDLAEKCNRSGEKQMHLLLVSHKDISNYIDTELPKDKVDGWRGVSGRFEHTYISNSFSQVYNVISSVIEKNEPYWSNFLIEHSDLFDALDITFNKLKMFKGVSCFREEVIDGCFPLHPISTFLLPRLSEKIAQNERTLFTFLASTSKNTLNNFLDTSTHPLLTPDWIYDYFDPLLRQEPVNSSTYNAYILSQRIINQLDNKLEIAIIKTIALIDIVEQFELLPPTPEMVINTFIQGYTEPSMIQDVLQNLIDQKFLVYLRKSNGFLKLKESSGVNIYQQIKDEKERSSGSYQVEQIINNMSKDKFFYPMRYNIENSITRYFDFKFMSSTVFYQITDWSYYLEQTLAEGIVFGIIPSSVADIGLVKNILQNQAFSNRILFILPREYESIDKIAFEYSAVEKLLNDTIVQEDKVLSAEYELVIKDLRVVLDNFIANYTSPHISASEYFYENTVQQVSRRSQLSEFLSTICEKIFTHTPIINNESINKNCLPTVALNSRTRILNGLLEPVLIEDLGLRGNGQDVSMMRSTLLQTNILSPLEKNDGVFFVEVSCEENSNMTHVLNKISDFIQNAQKTTPLQELYHYLTHPEHGIGLKLGVIPIYLALCLRPYLDFIVITKDKKEVRINADLLNSINKRPSDYFVKIINWDSEKELYFSDLEEIFKDYASKKDRALNRFTYVYEAMKRWYMSLPQYSKSSREVYCGRENALIFDPLPVPSQKFLQSFSNMSRNPQEFLVNEIPSFYNSNETSKELSLAVKRTKDFADNAIEILLDVLISDVKFLFSKNQNSEISLYSVICDWTDSLSADTFQHIFPTNETQILDLLKNIEHDEYQWIAKLAHITTSLRIEDWKKETILQFVDSLYLFKNVIEEFESSEKTAHQSAGYKLIIVKDNGDEETRFFDRTQYNGRANLLFNAVNTAVLDMGQSISKQEKRQVIMDILENLL